MKRVNLRVWGESTSDKEIYDNHAFEGQKGTFCLSLRLNVVYFRIRGTLSATNRIHKIKMRSVQYTGEL